MSKQQREMALEGIIMVIIMLYIRRHSHDFQEYNGKMNRRRMCVK